MKQKLYTQHFPSQLSITRSALPISSPSSYTVRKEIIARRASFSQHEFISSWRDGGESFMPRCVPTGNRRTGNCLELETENGMVPGSHVRSASDHVQLSIGYSYYKTCPVVNSEECMTATYLHACRFCERDKPPCWANAPAQLETSARVSDTV
jgi:hypothetical protein